MSPKQFVKLAGWRKGKSDAKSHRILDPDLLRKHAGSIFLPELVGEYVAGYEAANAYVMCAGQQGEWNEFFMGRKGKTGC